MGEMGPRFTCPQSHRVQSDMRALALVLRNSHNLTNSYLAFACYIGNRLCVPSQKGDLPECLHWQIA